MEYEMVDPYNFIAKESIIRASQVYTLFTTPFARHDPNDDIQVDNANDNDNDKDKDKDNDSDHDMWDQSSDDDVTHPDDDDVTTITFCSPPPSPAPNDVVSGVRDELGFESSQLNSPNDVVSDELGLIREGKGVRVRDDSVSDSASLPKQLKPCDTDTISTPIVDVEINDIEASSVNRPQIDVVSGDLGFQDVEIGGGDTPEVIFGDDTEELIECDANTEVITEEDGDEEEEEDEVNTGRNSSEEVKECLLYLLRVLTERQGNKDGDGDGEGDGVVDFLETAKRRGYTFPPPRWKLT